MLKWLLNERAVLAGAALRLQQKIAELQTQLDSVHSKVASLDTTMTVLAPNVSPAAAGVVHAQGQLGCRGSLKRAVLNALAAFGPTGIDVTSLARQVAEDLGLELKDEDAFLDFRKQSVHATLKRARVAGLVEAFSTGTGMGGGAASIWRLLPAGGTVPSLDALRALASEPASGETRLAVDLGPELSARQQDVLDEPRVAGGGGVGKGDGDDDARRSDSDEV